jgi:hypothetical protein
VINANVAFLILLHTGMRVGSLREIKVHLVTQAIDKSIQDLLHPNLKQGTAIGLLEKALVVICNNFTNLKAIKMLLQNKAANDPLFTNEKK